MDFVVVGFGLGALSVLLGVLMIGWLAGRADRAAAAAPSPAASSYHLATAAECRGAGQAFLYAGGAMILATIGGLAGALDDRTGALLIATTATVAVLGIFVWGYLHRSRYPLPPRPRRVRQETAASATAASTAAALPISNDNDMPAAEIAAPDAESEDGALVPALAVNGDHGNADDAAPATDTPQPDTGNGAAPEPAAAAQDSATRLDAERSAPNAVTDSPPHEPTDAAEDHAAEDLANNFVAFGVRRAGAGGAQPPPKDDNGPQGH